MLRAVNWGRGGGGGGGGGGLSSSRTARLGASGSCLDCVSVLRDPWRPTYCFGRLS